MPEITAPPVNPFGQPGNPSRTTTFPPLIDEAILIVMKDTGKKRNRVICEAMLDIEGMGERFRQAYTKVTREKQT